jgi:hypothetical protein
MYIKRFLTIALLISGSFISASEKLFQFKIGLNRQSIAQEKVTSLAAVTKILKDNTSLGIGQNDTIQYLLAGSEITDLTPIEELKKKMGQSSDIYCVIEKKNN